MLSDRLLRSKVSDTPLWRDQFSKGGWRARDPGAAEDIVGRLAGRRRLRGPHPLATSAQPLGRYAFGSSSHDGLKTKGEPL